MEREMEGLGKQESYGGRPKQVQEIGLNEALVTAFGHAKSRRIR